MMKPLLPTATLTLVLAALGCGRETQAPAPKLPSVKVHVVASGSPEHGWVAATLEARDQAVLAARAPASVKAVLVREGDPVKAGQLLAQLDDGDLQSGRDAAQASLHAAQAQQRRIADLFQQQAATQAELDQANTQLAQAKAALAGAQAGLRYTELRAPFVGTVRSRNADSGAFVTPGEPILTVDGVGLEVRAALTDSEAQGLKVGQVVPFEAEGQTGKARILALSVGGDPTTHRRDLRALVLSPAALHPGSFARIQVPGEGQTTAQWLPETALVHRGGLTGVFVVENGQAQLRWISLGEAQGGRLEVRAGLKATEAVVDAPGDLHDGQPVEVLHER